jgi:hypothetical protein
VPRPCQTLKKPRKSCPSLKNTWSRRIAADHTSTDIGTRLCIGSETVNTHIKNIYRKLDVRNRVYAVSLAAIHEFYNAVCFSAEVLARRVLDARLFDRRASSL